MIPSSDSSTVLFPVFYWALTWRFSSYFRDLGVFQGVKSLIEDFVKRNQPIFFLNLKPSIVEIFQGVKPKDFKHCSNEIELNELLQDKQRLAGVA